jgi:hypothetical protein
MLLWFRMPMMEAVAERSPPAARRQLRAKRKIRSGPLDSMRTKEEHIDKPNGSFAMSAPSQLLDNSRYEQACDQAIAMCDGNLRSTIKALIMANEYLEAELEELQAAVAAGCAPTKSVSRSNAA